MSTGHSPLNIKSMMFTKPALCDMVKKLAYKGSHIKRIDEIKEYYSK